MIKLGFYILLLPALLYDTSHSNINNGNPYLLAKIFSFLAAIDAISCMFLSGQSWFGKKSTDQDSIGKFLNGVIGLHAAGLAITSYLVTTQRTSIDLAIVYGHLARLVGISRLFVTGLIHESGIGVTTIVIVGGGYLFIAHNVFLELWEPMLCVKICAVVMGIWGALEILNPTGVVKFVIKYDIKDKASADLARFSSLYLLLNGLYISLITNKVDPIQSIAFTSMAMIPSIILINKQNILKLMNFETMSLLMVITFVGISKSLQLIHVEKMIQKSQ